MCLFLKLAQCIVSFVIAICNCYCHYYRYYYLTASYILYYIIEGKRIYIYIFANTTASTPGTTTTGTTTTTTSYIFDCRKKKLYPYLLLPLLLLLVTYHIFCCEKRVHIQKPAGTGSQYWCYNGAHLISLIGIADWRYRFFMADIGQFG